jgi:geranyl-CoA carboxylase alpha subunit
VPPETSSAPSCGGDDPLLHSPMIAFSKILIANRGEIACRIMRTAKALGYRTVAVFSDADAGALHVRLADEAARIGPPPAKDSYLNVDALLDAAKLAGADAVHPGYGFLSENASFAQACVAAGLIFVGPPASAIEAMGNKARAKALMQAAGVPCVPGYQGPDQSDEALLAEGGRIGFPLMVKAAAGGGGRGMRLVTAAPDLGNALSRARSEAASAFGSDELILERAVIDARHIEIQVFADGHGNIVHLGERDCSIQRRHQKVIEETPSPAVSVELRAKMGEAAVAAARAINYVSAGTVEFLLDDAGNFYFLEMNTRLQVEHPVTEAITGLDLVAWQLRVAADERLPLEQHEISFSGHAIEARLYAEDPYKNFLPQSGTLIDWRPAAGSGIRVDHGLAPGQRVSPFYDPMLAKVIGHGTSREEARRRVAAALEDTVVLGLNTNRAFLVAALRHPVFVAGDATTSFIEKYFPAGSDAMQRPKLDHCTFALAAILLFEARKPVASDAQVRAQPWSSTGAANWPLRLTVGEVHQPAIVSVVGSDRYLVTLGGDTVSISIENREDGAVRFTASGIQQTARFILHEGMLHLDLNGRIVVVRETTFEASDAARRDGSTRLLAPMNGAIIGVFAKPGEAVRRGQRIVVLEAMKMQHEIVAERDGLVDKILVKAGDQVATRQLLVELKADGAAMQDRAEESP